MVEHAVDFHDRLRFPRGDCGASSATPAGSPQTAISRSENPRVITQKTIYTITAMKNYLIHKGVFKQW
jgi:hypothetical protein